MLVLPVLPQEPSQDRFESIDPLDEIFDLGKSFSRPRSSSSSAFVMKEMSHIVLTLPATDDIVQLIESVAYILQNER